MTENEGDVFDYIELVESKNDKNTHLEHIEDFPITYGNKGLKDSIDFVEALHDMLKGNSPNRVFATTKVDGAPAIFCGTNPENGKFFVATKSLFNKNPKINYTVRDIDKNHPAPGLNTKLKEALKALRPLNIRGIIQGDLLFDSTSKKVENIDGEQCITFKPNTIKYAIPVKSVLGAKINTAKFGIAFHTAYTGRTIATLKANFNVRVKQYANRRDIFVTDVYLTDVSGVATMTAAETKKVENMVGKIKSNLPNGNFLDKLSKSNLAPLLLTYTNSRIREGQHLTNIAGHYNGFKEYVTQKYDKEAAKLKTDKAKQTRANQRDIYINDIKHNRDDYMKLFVVQSYLNELKMFYMSKLNRIQHMGRAFFEMPDGSYKATTPEGYVAVSHERGNAVKLVDRLAFSRQNFLAPKSFGRRAISESWIKRHIQKNMLEAYSKPAKEHIEYVINENFYRIDHGDNVPKTFSGEQQHGHDDDGNPISGVYATGHEHKMGHAYAVPRHIPWVYHGHKNGEKHLYIQDKHKETVEKATATLSKFNKNSGFKGLDGGTEENLSKKDETPHQQKKINSAEHIRKQGIKIHYVGDDEFKSKAHEAHNPSSSMSAAGAENIPEDMHEAYKKKKKKKNKYPRPKTPAGWVNYTYSAAPSGNGGGGDAGGGGE